MGKVTWHGEFDWFGAPAIPNERIMYTETVTKKGATAFFKCRIAKHLNVSISRVNGYYRNHPNGYSVKVVS